MARNGGKADGFEWSGRLRGWHSSERAAMGELLSTFPWSVYCTWTFRDRIGPVRALKEIRWWLRLPEFAYRDKLGWVVGLEQEQGAEWPHAHGLFCTRDEDLWQWYEPHNPSVWAGRSRLPLIEVYWRAWFDKHGAGRFVKVEGDGRGCSFYCSKYATKRGELYFSDNLATSRGQGTPARELTLLPAS
jgi:hypothetical protein